MQAEKRQQRQQSWKVNIQARAQKFNFKLKTTTILSTEKLHRFSLLLRLHNFILKLQVKSGPTLSVSTQRKRTPSLKSTFFRLLQKLRPRPANKTLTIRNPDLRYGLNRIKQFAANKKSVCAGSLVIAVLALLLQSIDKGIRTYTSIIFMYWILYFNRNIEGKTRFFWMVLVLIAGTMVALHLGKGYISEFAWSWRAWPWSYAVYCSGCYYYAAYLVILALVKIFFSHISKIKENWFKCIKLR